MKPEQEEFLPEQDDMWEPPTPTYQFKFNINDQIVYIGVGGLFSGTVEEITVTKKGIRYRIMPGLSSDFFISKYENEIWTSIDEALQHLKDQYYHRVNHEH